MLQALHAWLNTWSPHSLEAALAVQHAALALWHALGLTGTEAGQPAWPWAQRLNAELIASEPLHAQRMARALLGVAAVALGAVLAAVATIAAVVGQRRRRYQRALRTIGLVLIVPAAVLVVAGAAITPWAQWHLLWTPAQPSSLHRSPTGFTAEAIVRGQQVYTQHCAACHGAEARGDGPLAASLPMWPPQLTGGLLWKRLEGELFGRIRHGMRSRDGHTTTMPGFTPEQLPDDDIWAVLDYLQAHASGYTLRASGAWQRPVRAPIAPVQCRYDQAAGNASAQHRTTATLQGQRVQWVLGPSPALVGTATALPRRDTANVDASVNALAASAALPLPDPRWVTLWVGAVPPSLQAEVECWSDSAALHTALGWILGVEGSVESGVAERRAEASDVAPIEATKANPAAGQLLLSDRQGWLRARSTPGSNGWSVGDLVCRSGEGANAFAQPKEDGLDALLAQMDNDPVRLVRAGFPHR